MAEAVATEELARLLGEGERVIVGGAPVVVSPFKFGQLPAALKHVSALASALDGENLNLTRAITENGEDVIACLAIATGKPREWFDAIGIDEGVALLAAAVKVNGELFQKKVVPAIAGLTGLTKTLGGQT